MSKKSHEVVKDMKFPNTSHKQQKALRTNSSCKQLEMGKKSPNPMDLGGQDVRLLTKNNKIHFNNARQLD